MTYDEYLELHENLLTHLSRCKNEADTKRIISKLDKLEIKYDFPRREIGRPEAKLQEFGVMI